MSTPIDARTMPMDELRQLIMTENMPLEAAPEAPVEQPRDEQGRFVSAQAEPVVEAQADPVEAAEEVVAEPVTVEREIDLGDGSGIQVFRGTGTTEVEAYAALTDELTKAQANATKKIRELSRPAAPAPVVEATTPENDFLLAQQLMDSPQATLDKLFAKKLAAYEAQKKAEQDAADEREKQESQAVQQFMSANPEYYPVKQNGNRLERQMAIEGLPLTIENLQKVYNDLKADGLITPKPAEAAPVIRTRSSGLSTRSSVPPPPPPKVDLSKLSTDELLRLSGGYIYK